jgi:hypothetical protein
MCITVEKAHFDQLAIRIKQTVADLVAIAPSRRSEFLLELDPGYAEAAIVFRDFPKAHGNIISAAVGVALDGHIGGISKCEKTFTFLSGAKVSVDNFFMTSRGQIFLFETKRDFKQVRKDNQRNAARNLYDVAKLLETQAVRTTGRKLRHPIERVFFSYIHERSPRRAPVHLNIGTNQAALTISMKVFGRQEMNQLIGPCFGRFINSFDDFFGRQIGEMTHGLRLRHDREVTKNPLYEDRVSDTDFAIHFGADDCPAAPTESDVLE